MSYRKESDVYAPYGDFTPLDCQEMLTATRRLGRRDFSEGKNKMVAWICSNCRDDVGRLEYASKLARYIKVDIFGKCGKLNCSKGTYTRLSNDCKLKLKQYKFYLAFENSRCVDYITEKYWEVGLENELVPVVMGGADYSLVAIPGSYINVDDFDSVEKLAEYLTYLNTNHTAYNEYFKWKRMFKLDTPFMYGCALCTALQTSKVNKRKVYSSLHRFWKQDTCKGKLVVP
ncbi:hypothetical protein QZH41_007526 [Actinostola sp. cb2023]|nr:hypothetical protein QZH41_007526 [Actinostola sp. cb2023]